MRKIICKCGELVNIHIKEARVSDIMFKIEEEMIFSPVYIWLCTNCGKEYYLERQCPAYNLKENKNKGVTIK